MPDSGIEKVRAMLAGRPDRHSISLLDRRSAMDAMGAGAELPSNMELFESSVGGVACECIVPVQTQAVRSVLYVHGGAYVAGSPRSHRMLGISLCEKVNARVVMLDYRLAPENPFPAAVLDIVSAYRDMRSRTGEFGAIAIVGDSAGAGALISAMMMLRDAGDLLPEVAACISPWLDLSCSSGSYSRLAGEDPFLSRAGLLQDAESYLAGSDPKNPLASPLFGNPGSLPPMLIQTGSEEVLIDEITAFTQAAERAGCDITLEVWPEMIHVFHAFSALLPDARLAMDKLAAFISTRLT